MSAELTVACAAWHKQQNFALFFEQHVHCLLAQSIDVRVIYVVDGGLRLSYDDDRVTVVDVDRPITTAEALSMALALADTEYFAALNLDDCYFTDAAALQVELMAERNLHIVCGDWEIRHTPDADTDRPCFELSALTPCRDWPPPDRPGQRLGSGDGARGTYGPAPVFRTSALRRVGGYARRFGDGTPIRTIIDYIVWDRLHRAGGRFARLPLVVGSYYSDPGNQQEFRTGGEEAVLAEHRRYTQHGALI